MNKPTCKHCGLTEGEHHEFERVTPDGCVCIPRVWAQLKRIPPVCKDYTGEDGNYCEKCEHEKACHK